MSSITSHNHVFDPDLSGLSLIPIQYDSGLVLLSILISVIAAYAALVVLQRVQAANTESMQRAWIYIGAVVFGIGVWSMHFTGMIAYALPIQVSYGLGVTGVSVFPAIIGSALALKKMSQHQGHTCIVLGALYLAVGIGSMHYIGMEAMQIDAVMVYDITLFVFSIVVAFLLALFALSVHVKFKSQKQSQVLIGIESLLLGFSVSGMHYTAMASSKVYSIQSLANTQFMTMDNAVVIGLGVFVACSVFIGITLVAAVFDKNLQNVSDHSRDVELREQSILQALADALLIFDEEGFLQSANASAKNLLKIEGDVLNIHMTDILPNIDVMVINDRSADQIRSRLTEISAYALDGSSVQSEYILSKVHMHEELIYIVVLRDVSERKAIEFQLQSAQKLESVGQLASGIAHEINTPTQYILDNVSFVKESFDDLSALLKLNQQYWQQSPEALLAIDAQFEEIMHTADLDFVMEEVPQALSQSIEGLHAVSNIIKAMKSFSHPSKGQYENVDIEECVNNTATIARNEWKYYAKLNVTAEEGLPLIPVIRDELCQVLLNMIVNAAHAIEDRYGSQESIVGEINIALSVRHGYCVIEIADNGSGMSEDVQAKIFNPFFTTKVVGKGTGQGLSLSRAVIVDTHKGKIDVESIVDEGTRFYLYLPIDAT